MAETAGVPSYASAMKTFLTAVLLVACAAPAFAAMGGPVNANGSLKAGYTVTQRSRGNCFAGSIQSSASNSYRCMIGNNIIDPCYAASKSARVVYCPFPSSPRKVLQISLTGALPAQ